GPAYGLVGVAAVLDGVGDRVAAGRLSAVDFAPRIGDQADLVELAEGLVNLADQAAAGHWRDNVLRRSPAELLGDFKTQRLGTLGVEGAQVDVDEAPAVLKSDLGTQPIDLVVGPLDADELGAVDAGA